MNSNKTAHKGWSVACCALLSAYILAGNGYAQQDAGKFPPLTFSKIAGAPALTTPVLIQGKSKPVIAEGHGWAAPAFADVDGDGLKDLLIGEFGSRYEHGGKSAGSFVRVYKNEGTTGAPRFADWFNYLFSPEPHGLGTPLSIYTWCCFGFTPQLVDLDGDGYDDLVTGAYNPGYVTWFRGSDAGFMPGEKLPQYGDPMDGRMMTDFSASIADPKSYTYWNYSAVAFGDFEGKGLQDMIVGGAALRISRNIGTKTSPSFGIREMLLDIHGEPLRISSVADTQQNRAGEPYLGHAMVPAVADWDADGIPDLFVTNAYTGPGSEAVTFFRGVRTGEGLRFEPGIPLFTAPNGQKAMPGSWLRVAIVDWNDDGIKDLLIGASVATLGGEFDHRLSWTWEHETGIAKMNPAYYSDQMIAIINRSLHSADSMRISKGLTDEEFAKAGYYSRAALLENFYGKGDHKTLAHQGYIYVMLGRKEGDE